MAAMEQREPPEPEVDVDVAPEKPRRPRLNQRTVIALALIVSATALGISGALPAEQVLRLLGLAASSGTPAPSADGAGGEKP
jgi:hypothetical protein